MMAITELAFAQAVRPAPSLCIPLSRARGGAVRIRRRAKVRRAAGAGENGSRLRTGLY